MMRERGERFVTSWDGQPVIIVISIIISLPFTTCVAIAMTSESSVAGVKCHSTKAEKSERRERENLEKLGRELLAICKANFAFPNVN
jgi:hypothetical protein